MDDVARMSDADLDRLLAGKAPAGGPARGPARQEDVEGLQGFFRDLKSRYAEEVSPAVEEAHLARIVNAARLHTDQMRPAPQSSGDAGQSRRPQWRRKIVLSSLFGSLTAKLLAAGALAATAATGGLAATGALPSPVQQAVAGAAGDVGVTLPNPAASQAAIAGAQETAQKVASTVDTLAQQVSTAAEKPAAFGAEAVQSAQTCSENVTTLAAQLASDAAGATTPALAQSLAGRATALAQEALGCALPARGSVPVIVVPQAPAAAPDASADAAARAVAGAVHGCATELKPSVESLVQTAMTARTPAQVQALATQARAVADAALGCAKGMGTALEDVATSLPTPLPKAPAATTPLSGVLKLMPGAAKLVPSPPAADSVKAATQTPNVKGPWWTSFLSSVPSSVPAPATSGASAPGSAGGAGSWAGMTGSWSSSGSWNPYQVGKGSSQDSHEGSHPKH